LTLGLVLDAGPLIAFERDDRFTYKLLTRTLERNGALVIPAGVVAQVWRDGRTQTRLARLLALDEVHVETLDDLGARAAGQLCGLTGTSDIVDASVVLTARRRKLSVVTSDPEDLRRLAPDVDLITV